MDLLLVPLTIKQLIYLFAVSICVYLAQHVYPNPHVYWLIWSALLLAFVKNGDSFLSRVLIILFSGFIMSASVFIASWLASHWVGWLALYLFIVTYVCMSFMLRVKKYTLITFIIIFFSIIAASFPVNMHESIFRSFFILGGTLIAALLQIVFLFHFRKDEINYAFYKALHCLKFLNNEIFSCLLQTEYSSNIYLFERRLHIQKRKCVKSLMRLEALIKNFKMHNKNVSPWKKVLARLEKTYAVMLDYSLIRHRVTDHNTFAVCKDELSAIDNEIDTLFYQIKNLIRQADDISFIPLEENIKRLDDSYHNVIQIAAREPMVFLLLVNSFNFLRDELEQLALTVQELT